MNKMQKISLVWGIIIVVIFASLTTFGLFYKNKTKGYKELEKQIVEAEKKYVDAKFLYPQNKTVLKTSAEELINEGYLKELKYEGDTCDGYVLVELKKNAYQYYGYITCQNYQTNDYDDNK